jgi:hypothetical protein
VRPLLLERLLDFELDLLEPELELPEDWFDEEPELPLLLEDWFPDRIDRLLDEDPEELFRERTPDEDEFRFDGCFMALPEPCVLVVLPLFDRFVDVETRLTFEPAVGVVLVRCVDTVVLSELVVRVLVLLTSPRLDFRDLFVLLLPVALAVLPPAERGDAVGA